MRISKGALVLLLGGIAGATLAATAPPSWTSIILTPGSAPGSPTNGQLWTTTAGLFARINGGTVGPMSAGGGGSPGGSNGQVQFNNSGSFGGLTNTQLTADINAFTSSLSGAAPASAGGTTNYLRADGTWAAPPTGSTTFANPTATAGPTANNGVATTAMRSDASPAVQLGTSAQKGIVQVDNQTVVANSGVISTASPTRTATNPTVATTDMGGTIWATGTTTIPAITTGLFDAKQTLLLVNVSGSTETVTSSPTVNPGAGCVQASGIPAGYAWQLQSNNTTLDCLQIVSPTLGTLATTTPGTNVAAAAAVTLSAAGGLSSTIGSGTAALGTSAIASGACATAVQTAITNTATTDVIWWGFNADPTGVTGYAPTTNGMLTIIAYPTSGNANFKVCNNTSASVTPGAITLNVRVIR